MTDAVGKMSAAATPGYQLMADTIFEVSGYERLLDGET